MPSACERAGAPRSPRSVGSSSARRAASTPPRAAKALAAARAELDAPRRAGPGSRRRPRAAPSTRSCAAPRWCPTRRSRPARSASGPRWRRAAARAARPRGCPPRRPGTAARPPAGRTGSPRCGPRWRSTSGGLARLLRPHGAVGEQPGDAHLHERPRPRRVERRRQLVPHAAPARGRGPTAGARSGRSGRCRRARGPGRVRMTAQPSPTLAEHRVGPGPHVVEEHLVEVVGAEHAADRPHGDARACPSGRGTS